MMLAWLTRLLLIALCAYAAVALFAYFASDGMIFQPPRSSYTVNTLPFQRIPVGTQDSLAVTYLPHEDARYTLLFSHGNAEDLGHVLPFLQAMRDVGFSVVGYDYRGYGQSGSGPATASKAIDDAEAVFQYVTGDLGVPPDQIIIFGRSVGSGPAVELAARHAAAGLVLESAFTTAFRVMTRVSLLPFDKFSNLTRIRDVRCPVLVMHGTRDFVIPWSHGQQLLAAASEPKRAYWVEGAGHNDLALVAGAGYAQAFKELVTLIDEQAAVR